MLMQGLKTLVGSDSGESGVDVILNGLGISAAVVSASFAGYMVVTGPADVSAHSGAQFNILMTDDTREQALAARKNAQRSQAGASPIDGPGIDFTPTGTVSAEEADPQREEDAQTSAQASMQDFSVRDVFDGTALVEARDTLQLVKPGTVLDGAGKVLSIQKKGSAWVVVTTGGVINQRR